MAKIKAVIFDFIGTLAELVGYSLEEAENRLFRSLIADGYEINFKSFFQAYNEAQKKYRKIRYEELIEVTNAVWISDALNLIGYATTSEDEKIKNAVHVFFENYLKALKRRPSAISTLQKLSENYKLGLVSNFTYTPIIVKGLRKLKINGFFNAALVSDAVGWRKPHPKIFQEALNRLQVEADEVLYVGDTPIEDIQGAKSMGMKTSFIPSQFHSLDKMQRAGQQPDFIVEKLSDIIIILKRLSL